MANQKQVADRLRSAEKVIEVVRTQGAVMAAGLRARFGAPDYDAMPTLTHVAGAITQAAEGLRAAMEAHADELADDVEPRAARAEVAEEVYATLVKLRRTLGGIYGPNGLAALGQAGTLDRRPDRLLIASEALLRTAPEVLPGLQGGLGLSVDPAQVAQAIGGGVEALRAALAAVTREEREAQLTLLARDEALSAYDQTFTHAAATLAALFRLAGMPEHAARVRPSGRRPGRVEEDDAIDDVSDLDGDAAPEG